MVPKTIGCPAFPNMELLRYGVTNYWFGTAVTDAGMLSTLFVAACRSLATLDKSEKYTRGLSFYKLQAIQSLNRALSEERDAISDTSVAKGVALAIDSVSNVEELLHVALTDSCGQFIGMEYAVSKQHVGAVWSMVDMKGGLEMLGMGGFLSSLITHLWAHRDSHDMDGSISDTNPCNPFFI